MKENAPPNHTVAAVLTPGGLAAIATIAVVGPGAPTIVNSLFQGSVQLLDQPGPGRVWHGWFGNQVKDQVAISVNRGAPLPWIEVHCHGGAEVVQALLQDLADAGAAPVSWQDLPARRPASPIQLEADRVLPAALTLRAATILLWQVNGACDQALEQIRTALRSSSNAEAAQLLCALRKRSRTGLHLTVPWRIVLAGAPNAGKSSLMNVLAGVQRSIVTPTAGTTRDVVTSLLAFEGWPAAVADTAGLRAPGDELEEAGIARANREIERADLCLWVLDGSADPVWPARSPANLLLVVNKIDLPPGWDWMALEGACRISAVTGQGIEDLSRTIGRALVPDPPLPGEAVPFTPELCDAISSAGSLMERGRSQATLELVEQLLIGDSSREIVQNP
jgi:tRNA modification GTPase